MSTLYRKEDHPENRFEETGSRKQVRGNRFEMAKYVEFGGYEVSPKYCE